MDKIYREELHIQTLISQLKAAERETRMEAAQQLGELAAASAIDPLLESLNDEDWTIQYWTVRAFAKIKVNEPKIITALLELAKNKATDVVVIEAIVTALTELKALEALPWFFELAADKTNDNENLRQLAFFALGEVRTDATIEFLLKYLRDSTAETYHWFIGQALAKFGDEVIAPLFKGLSDKRPAVRLYFVRAIWQLENPILIDPLLKAAADPNPEVRREILWVLGVLNKEDARVIAQFLKALSDPKAQVRSTAINFAARTGNPDFLPGLRKMAKKDAVYWVKQSAAETVNALELAHPELR